MFLFSIFFLSLSPPFNILCNVGRERGFWMKKDRKNEGRTVAQAANNCNNK